MYVMKRHEENVSATRSNKMAPFSCGGVLSPCTREMISFEWLVIFIYISLIIIFI